MTDIVSLEQVPCSVCGSVDHFVLYRSAPMRTGVFQGVRNTLCQCNECGFVYSNPRPGEQDYVRHYSELDEGSGQVFRELGGRSTVSEGSVMLARYISDLIAQKPSGRLVDIGCGVGVFLNALEGQDWCFEGVEPSSSAADTAAASGRRVHNTFLGGEALPADAFDVVTILNVLEHIWDPNAALAEIARIAKDDALLAIAVPNTRYPILGLAEFFEIEHLSHFSAYTLKTLLERHGWRDVHWEKRFGEENGLMLLATRRPGSWNGLPDAELHDDRAAVREQIDAYAQNRKKLLAQLHHSFQSQLGHWEAGRKRVALYGAGSFAAQLVEALDGQMFFDQVFDGDARKWGQTFLGFPIKAPEDIRACGADIFVVSSGAFAEEITAAILEHVDRDVEIFTVSEAGLEPVS